MGPAVGLMVLCPAGRLVTVVGTMVPEAVRAIDWPIAARLKRYLCLFATVCAGHGVHASLASFKVASGGLPRGCSARGVRAAHVTAFAVALAVCSAVRASSGFTCEPFACVEFLLTRREYKIIGAITTRECLVGHCHTRSLPCLPDSSCDPAFHTQTGRDPLPAHASAIVILTVAAPTGTGVNEGRLDD